ncbi:MAG: sugar phosphate isomerase/epimerase [Planctomycetes bacterium]|nr:sugar phosphate isomerase/epimerase [Planctomycetota bacterium]
MIFGVATWALDGDPLPERFVKLADMGFRAMSMVAGQQEQAEAEWDAVQRVLEDRELCLTIHLCCGFSGVAGLDGALPPLIAPIIRWQKRSGRIRNVTFDSAYRPDATEGEKVWNREGTIAGLRYACEQFAPLGIRVGIENWLINHRLDQFRAIRDGVGRDDLAMLLDVGHLNIALQTPEAGIPSAESWVLDQPFEIIELHLHDNDGKLDQHLPIGEGTLDLPPMVSALKKRGFEGVATVELVLKDSRSIDDAAVRERYQRTRDAFAQVFSS